MARGVLKVTLDLFPCVDENGIRTGNYGARLMVGASEVQIPSGFKPSLVIGSQTGEVGSGTVEGAVFLKYNGDGPCPVEWEDLNGKTVHSLRFSGPNGTTVGMDFLLALGDSMLPVELYSKRWVAENGAPADPADPGHPYADTDNDGIPNWRDVNWTDGPGWEVPEEPVPDPETVPIPEGEQP